MGSPQGLPAVTERRKILIEPIEPEEVGLLGADETSLARPMFSRRWTRDLAVQSTWNAWAMVVLGVRMVVQSLSRTQYVSARQEESRPLSETPTCIRCIRAVG